VLAHLSPFYEQEALLRGLDLSVPLYVDLTRDAVAEQNKPIVEPHRVTVSLPK